ncbi:MAG: YqgE/AlgH family protein [Chthoniobacterales bacterium]
MRNVTGDIPRNLTGMMLVAHPTLLDPNFRRAVLFISAHDSNDGALGLILNRPLDKQVGDLVTEEAPAALAEVPVYLGGPVGKNQLMFAALQWEKGHGLKLNHNVGMEQANELIGLDPESVRAFVGYAGWGGGQLEEEMKQNAWIIHKPTEATLKSANLPKLWFNIMRGMGPWYKLMSAAPDDPSLN